MCLNVYTPIYFMGFHNSSSHNLDYTLYQPLLLPYKLKSKHLQNIFHALDSNVWQTYVPNQV